MPKRKAPYRKPWRVSAVRQAHSAITSAVRRGELGRAAKILKAAPRQYQAVFWLLTFFGKR